MGGDVLGSSFGGRRYRVSKNTNTHVVNMSYRLTFCKSLYSFAAYFSASAVLC